MQVDFTRAEMDMILDGLVALRDADPAWIESELVVEVNQSYRDRTNALIDRIYDDVLTSYKGDT